VHLPEPPAWVVAIGAGIGRRFVLAATALVVVVAQLVFVLPKFMAAQPVPPWGRHGPHRPSLDANVSYTNDKSMSGYASEIKSDHTKLLTLEEATPFEVGLLKQPGALNHLPFDYQVARLDSKAFFVASRYRLSGSRVVHIGDLPLLVETTILPERSPSGWFIPPHRSRAHLAHGRNSWR
jgi:hypothetical protein